MGRNGNGGLERRVRDEEEDSSILAVPEAVALSDAGNVLLSAQGGSLVKKHTRTQVNKQGFLLENDATISCLSVRPAQMQVISVKILAKELTGHLL